MAPGPFPILTWWVKAGPPKASGEQGCGATMQRGARGPQSQGNQGSGRPGEGCKVGRGTGARRASFCKSSSLAGQAVQLGLRLTRQERPHSHSNEATPALKGGLQGPPGNASPASPSHWLQAGQPARLADGQGEFCSGPSPAPPPKQGELMVSETHSRWTERRARTPGSTVPGGSGDAAATDQGENCFIREGGLWPYNRSSDL